MSRPWKSELRVRLRTSRCDAVMRRGHWRPRALAAAGAEGKPADSLAAAIGGVRESLARLGEATWHASSRPAVTLSVPDERVYYALLPARGPWAQQQSQARAYFETALGRDSLTVRAALLPHGGHWLAAAVESDDVLQWRSSVDAAGAKLAQLRPALADDLSLLCEDRSVADALLVLLRDEGASLVRLHGLRPAALSWLRVAPHDASGLLRGVRAFALGAPPVRDDAPVILLPQDDAQQQRWTVAAAHCGWELRAPLHPFSAEGRPS